MQPFLLIISIQEIIIPEDVFCGAKKIEKLCEGCTLWYIISQKKLLSNKTLVLRDKIQSWILSQNNVIGSPDKDDFLKIGKRVTWNKEFFKKSLQITIS